MKKVEEQKVHQIVPHFQNIRSSLKVSARIDSFLLLYYSAVSHFAATKTKTRQNPKHCIGSTKPYWSIPPQTHPVNSACRQQPSVAATGNSLVTRWHHCYASLHFGRHHGNKTLHRQQTEGKRWNVARAANKPHRSVFQKRPHLPKPEYQTEVSRRMCSAAPFLAVTMCSLLERSFIDLGVM